jgi:hypothetical protein
MVREAIRGCQARAGSGQGWREGGQQHAGAEKKMKKIKQKMGNPFMNSQPRPARKRLFN